MGVKAVLGSAMLPHVTFCFRLAKRDPIVIRNYLSWGD